MTHNNKWATWNHKLSELNSCYLNKSNWKSAFYNHYLLKTQGQNFRLSLICHKRCHHWFYLRQKYFKAQGSALLLYVYFITEVSWKSLFCRGGFWMESDRIHSQRWRYFLWRILWWYNWWKFGLQKWNATVWWQYKGTRILLGRPQLLFVDIYLDAD